MFDLISLRHATMLRFRFNLKLMFLAMLNVCIIVWGMRALEIGSDVALVLIAVVASLTGAWCALAWQRNAIVMATAGGFVGMVAFASCFWLRDLIEYFSYTGNDEYWEDGFFVVYLGLMIEWGGLGAVVGLVCGSLVCIIQRHWRQWLSAIPRTPDALTSAPFVLKCLRIAVTAFGLTACVLLVLLWRHSAQGADAFFSFSRARRVEVWSGQGRFFVYVRPPIAGAASLDPASFEKARSTYMTVMQGQLVSSRSWGFCPMPETNSFGFNLSSWNRFVMPYWFPLAITAALAAMPWIRWHFSLRTLLIGTMLVAVGLGIVVALR